MMRSKTMHPISGEHRKILEEGSAIAREVYEESGVWSVGRGRELPSGFSRRQRGRGSGILFAVTRPNGETSWSYRPDAVDPENPGHKYEQPCKKLGAPGNVLYVHPSTRHLIDDARVPVIFVEGVKKALSIVTAARVAGAEVLVVAISGVWNWLSNGKPIADMLRIPVDGREVYICFDSDVFYNPDVADAARRLTGHLIGRGARVWIAYLPDQADGSKTGADDYLAGGHSYAELMALMRPFDPADLASERLKRDHKLQLMLEDLARIFWANEWKGMGGHSSRDLYKVLRDVAPERGKLHADGLRVKISRGELARMAKVSTRTLQKAIERLEAMGLIYRDNEGRRPRERGAFVLRAGVNHYEESAAKLKTTADTEQGATPGSLHLRAPRLRWSSPAYKPRRGLVRGTRKVRMGPPTKPRPAVKRLGKIRGAVVDTLEAFGGAAAPDEVCEALRRSRPRDLVRFKASEKGHDGPVVMLLEAGIVQWVSDVETRREILRLTPNWIERIEGARGLGGELEAERLEWERHKRRSKAYRNREKVEVDYHYVNVGADGHVEELRRDDEPKESVSDPAPVSPLAAAIRDYLDRNPHDADQLPGWIGSTLWALDLFKGKPTPAGVRTAIGELGGEAYLRGKLSRAREAA